MCSARRCLIRNQDLSSDRFLLCDSPSFIIEIWLLTERLGHHYIILFTTNAQPLWSKSILYKRRHKSQRAVRNKIAWHQKRHPVFLVKHKVCLCLQDLTISASLHAPRNSISFCSLVDLKQTLLFFHICLLLIGPRSSTTRCPNARNFVIDK